MQYCSRILIYTSGDSISLIRGTRSKIMRYSTDNDILTIEWSNGTCAFFDLDKIQGFMAVAEEE